MYPPMDGYDEQPQSIRDEIDAALLHLVEIGVIAFSWDDEREEFIFWSTEKVS